MRSPSLKAQNFQCKFRLCTSSRSRSVSGASAGSYAQGQRKHILRHTVLHSASSESPLPRYSNKAGMRGAPAKQHGPKTGLYLEVSFNSLCVCAHVCVHVCAYTCVCGSACPCMCMCSYASVCTRMHVHAYVGVYVCASICNCMWECTCVG